tara:strand:+ start:346 stop:579 length:234 start_codon:yes stop_codon:yes gene_type:complete
MRNPQATSFIRNFNAKRITSSWSATDEAYGFAVFPDRDNTQPFCFQNGQAKAMADEYKRKQAMLDKAEALAILDSLL